MDYPTKNIRNFCIIAHIDHGKSTLADRLIELSGNVSKREMKSQLLDNMDLERERGITIKLNAVSLVYKASDGEEYLLNMIDTPGHVDFTYEVSRSMAACEGALLIVDAAQGVEAQTLANVYLALDNDLMIVPIINKIDLPNANIENAKKEINDRIGLDGENALLVSAKTGENIDKVLELIINEIPAPTGESKAPLSALVFDSYYDAYRGVVVLVRIKEGAVKEGDTIRFMASGEDYIVTELGYRDPAEVRRKTLRAGEVGYICAQIKDIHDVAIGDTITLASKPTKEPLPGYRKIMPMVYSGMYPVESKRYGDLKDALEKLSLNDAALFYEPEVSSALGFGFRCGFLGLLHMDIIQERLEREYDIDLILTAPTVTYKVKMTNGEYIDISNPAKMPKPQEYEAIYEPFVKASIMTPPEFIGPVMELCQEKRGEYRDLQYLDDTRNIIVYEMPLSEIIYNFFDKLKSVSRGYATFDYEVLEYRQSNLVKMDILLNGEIVDALSSIVYRPNAYYRGNKLVRKLKDIIPRHLFQIPVQAAINNKVIARADVKALRKDVTARCYGGDVSRKKKLLEKQKEGKKRMKAVGSVEIPQEAFMSILSVDDSSD